MDDNLSFPTMFHALTGCGRFPWQEELYERLSRGEFPEACDIPTGLGKTAAIPIWLIALANGVRDVPRRLVYVVNRRTVVDQATVEAERIRTRLTDPGVDGPTLEIEKARRHLADSLRALAADRSQVPLAISTLRGQFADNREWSADPSRPAVIVGTVDMIGSRLLFGGYGIGFKTRPLHAGFLGQDAWIVHDEAHLEPAFQALIEAIRDEQVKEPAPLGEGRRLKVMALTATPRRGKALEISEADRSHPVVKKRIRAKKSIHLHGYPDEKKLPDLIADLALSHQESKRAILVFARSVEVVDKVAERLRKAKQQVETLTGTMRGKEREALVGKSVFRRFLPNHGDASETVYLVCTSAGEVGVNISADHLVCDLSTFESMAQRFGRINRYGERDDTRIDILHPTDFDEKDEIEARRKRTLALLRGLDGNGSPDALGKLDRADRLAAFGPGPEILPTSDILFDVWALTTIREKLPGRPPLEPYLHGRSEREPPQTAVAWHGEVGILVGPLLDRYKPEDLLEDYPLKPQEWLRDRSDRVFKHLVALSERSPGAMAWLVDDDGTVLPLTLKDLADKEKKEEINGRTVLLSPDVGGLEGGLLNGRSTTADDVSDDWFDVDGERRRARLWGDEPPPSGMRLIRTIDTNPDAEDEPLEEEGASPHSWRWFVKPWSADDDGSRTSRAAVDWGVHTRDVEERTIRIIEELPLSDDIKSILVLAAKFHDLGKKRPLWQRSIGNLDPTNCLAKAGRPKRGKAINPLATDYRHEFGSLLDVSREPDFHKLTDDQKDLVLHLIAVHHGRGRPHFVADEAFDPGWAQAEVLRVAAEVPRRFARLQRKFGRWGLAYLESLLRAADYAASASPSETVEDAP